MPPPHTGEPGDPRRPDRSAPPEGPDTPETGVDVGAPIEAVWSVVADPRTYPLWLVGARRIRSVDEGWPSPGTAFHHTVGWLAVRLRDRTEVVSADPPRRLVLRAHLSVLGSATVTIDLVERNGTTHVAMTEAPHDGPLRGLWRFGARNLLKLSLWGRNRRSLGRLETGIEDGVIVGVAPPRG